MSPLAEEVLSNITRAIENDQLVLPTLPEVALRAREAAEDPDVCAASLSKVVGNDAALSARIIKVANSPLLRASRKIENLLMAINRLGLTFTANLITGLAMEQMFQATNDSVDKKMREIWQHSTEVAGIAHVICRQYTRLKPDEATLAGLVHGIGVLPILTYVEENSDILESDDQLDDVIRECHTKLGAMILNHWDFPEEMQLVPELYLDFSRSHEGGPDYVDVVQVANLQAYLGKDHPYNELDWSTIPSFDKLGFNVDDSEDEDLNAQMQAAMSLLQ